MTFAVATIAYLLVGMAFYMTTTAKGPTFIDLVKGVHKAGAVLRMSTFNNWFSTICATLIVLSIWPIAMVLHTIDLIKGDTRGAR